MRVKSLLISLALLALASGCAIDWNRGLYEGIQKQEQLKAERNHEAPTNLNNMSYEEYQKSLNSSQPLK